MALLQVSQPLCFGQQDRVSILKSRVLPSGPKPRDFPGRVPARTSERAFRPRQLVAATASPSFGRSSSFGAESGLGIPSPLSSSPVRSSFPSSCEDEQDESTFLNAICYPEVVLDDTGEEAPTSAPFASPLSCSWPEGTIRDLRSQPVSLPVVLPPAESNPGSLLAESPVPGPCVELWRQGAAAAVLKAEENYRKAWEDLQRAEVRLLSTRRVASELNALPLVSGTDLSPLPASLPSLDFVEELEDMYSGQAAPKDEVPVESREALLDLAWEDGVWCIEACGADHHDDHAGDFGSAKDELLDAEGAMARSRAALDSAARDLISRLGEEGELQAQVMNRHIEVMDQGAQHQVARWLVEEMDAASRTSSEPGSAGPAVSDGASNALAVPLDLDLAMRGYDDHAVRFLRHLPYDQVMKIRTIPPTKETKTRQAAGAVADGLERILSQPAGQPALPLQGVGRNRKSQEGFQVQPRDDVAGSKEAQLASKTQPAELKGLEKAGSGDIPALPSPKGWLSRRGADNSHGKTKYHSKLVLLGCVVSSVAAYMVANFELAVLAKDVSVILVAMSLAFMAAQFVWRSSSGPIPSLNDEPAGEMATDLDERALLQRSEPALMCNGTGNLTQRRNSSPSQTLYRRGPSWDQVIWLLGGMAVILSLSTMVALACKAAQAGLTALSVMVCSLVVRIIPAGVSSFASMTNATSSLPALVRQVSSSLWLVVGGDLLSSGVEVLGSAAAWAMLLLCVAFSIASAPVCIASSTSRRVNELLALARSHSESASEAS